jgi:hypothetical protein
MTIATEIPVDPVTIAIEQVAGIVSGNGAWQESVARYSKEESREFIVKSFLRVPDQQVDHPWAIIFELPGYTWPRLADGLVMPRGSLFLHLVNPMDAPDPELEERRFNNWHGQIVQGIARHRGAGYLFIATQTDPPTRTAPKDEASQRPFWEVGYSLEWSPFG